MNEYDTTYYPQFTGLKAQNPGLQVFISIGGWAAGGQIFSQMTSSAANRQAFISSAIAFMQTYGFDGIDIDWEYPAAGDRGGVAADTANYVLFMQELRAACGSSYGISATLPTSYWYLQGFNIVGMQPYVDWFNFMSYDIHGTWDGNNPFTAKVVNPHTNLTEVSLGLDLLWRNLIDPSKVVLGLAFYGRTFTLADPTCTTPGCPFSAGGDAGTCTQTSGILSNAEIQRIIKANNLTPTIDQTAAVKWISWGDSQWASYDDAETYRLKQSFANNLCLGGTMVWAIDLDDPATSQSSDNLNLNVLRYMGDPVDSNPLFARQKLGATLEQNSISLLSFWTECSSNPQCPDEFQLLTTGHGKVFDAELGHISADQCVGGGLGYNRALCIESAVQAQGCRWTGLPSGCGGTCAPGEFLVSQNSWAGGSRTGCLPGSYSSYCCAAITIPGSSLSYCPTSNSDIAFSGGFANYKRGSKYRRNPIWGTQLECASYGEAQDYMPSFFDDPTPGFQPQGLILNAHPGVWRINPVWDSFVWFPLGLVPYPPAETNVPCTVTITNTMEQTTTSPLSTRTCDGASYAQACLHYSSVQSAYNGVIDILTCKVSPTYQYRIAPSIWDSQHTKAWRYWVPIFYKPLRPGVVDTCNKDEWPPFSFQYIPQTQAIRFLSAYENKAAGRLWKSLCRYPVSRSTSIEVGTIYASTCYYTEHITYTVNAMTFSYINMPPYSNAGLGSNGCNPWTLTTDSGFALLTDDWYYVRTAPIADVNGASAYQSAPVSLITAGKFPPRTSPAKKKRWLDEPFDETVDMNDIIVDEGNTTRRATDEELWETYRVMRCVSENCDSELRVLGVKDEDLERFPQRLHPRRTSPAIATAEATQRSVTSTTAEPAPSVASTSSSLDRAVADNAEKTKLLAPTTPPKADVVHKRSRAGFFLVIY